ncbi:MAG: hypothetical protein H7A39_06060 [Chlamydiales bacterium]|nr:hypothetical protein [Chlamydiales bacterium]
MDPSEGLRQRRAEQPAEAITQQANQRNPQDCVLRKITAVVLVCMVIIAACFGMVVMFPWRVQPAFQGATQETLSQQISLQSAADSIVVATDPLVELSVGALEATAIDPPILTSNLDNPLLAIIQNDQDYSSILRQRIIEQVLLGVSDSDLEEAITQAAQQNMEQVEGLLRSLQDPVVCLFYAGQLYRSDLENLTQVRNQFIDQHHSKLLDVPFLSIYLSHSGIDLGGITLSQIDEAIKDIKKRISHVTTLSLGGLVLGGEQTVLKIISELQPETVLLDYQQFNQLVIEDMKPGVYSFAGKVRKWGVYVGICEMNRVQFIHGSQVYVAREMFFTDHPTYISGRVTWDLFRNANSYSLERLHVSVSGLAEMNALAKFLPKSNVQSLKLSGDFQDFEISLLAEAIESTPSLYDLDLSAVPLDTKSLYFLANALSKTRIRELKLNLSKTDSFSILASEIESSHLRHLEVFSNKQFDITPLVYVLKKSKLSSLRLKNAVVNRDAIVALWGDIASSTLQLISFNECKVLAPQSIQTVRNLILRSQLHSIDLSGSFSAFQLIPPKSRNHAPQETEELIPLAQITNKPSLRYLNLNGAPITDNFLMAISGLSKNLAYLDLSAPAPRDNYKAKDEGIVALSRKLPMSNLQTLCLNNHMMSNQGFKELVRLAAESGIQEVQVKNNQNTYHLDTSWMSGYLEGKTLKVMT